MTNMYLSPSRINNCVGELNQKYFLQFLFYVGMYVISQILHECTDSEKSLLTRFLNYNNPD